MWLTSTFKLSFFNRRLKCSKMEMSSSLFKNGQKLGISNMLQWMTLSFRGSSQIASAPLHFFSPKAIHSGPSLWRTRLGSRACSTRLLDSVGWHQPAGEIQSVWKLEKKENYGEPVTQLWRTVESLFLQTAAGFWAGTIEKNFWVLCFDAQKTLRRKESLWWRLERDVQRHVIVVCIQQFR